MRSALAIILALVSPLLFPWPLAALIVLVAACLLPPVGLLAGLLTDVLYFSGNTHLPYATILGALITIFGFLVHEFWRTRIMD